MSTPLKPAKGTVAIRMYRAGFGDCFLLAFPAKNKKVKYMLIDCGVHHNFPEKEKLLESIAADIQETTGGELEVLVVSHEHTDHILGFSAANEHFDKMTINHVWMGWTEKYNDPKVKKLDKKKKFYLQGLHSAANLVASKDEDFSNRVKGVLGFYDDEAFFARGNKKPKKMYNRQTMEWLQQKAELGPVFCTPGQEPLTLEGVDGVRVFVLGPPTDEQLLKKDSPSKGSKKETYLSDGSTELYDSFVNGVLKMKGLSGQTTSLSGEVKTPFSEVYGVQPGAGSQSSLITRYNKKENAWRKIDDEWLNVASELAIKMDNDTNNSSLVLAIELGENGKVLLFPGDAQVGNWLSWQDLTWDFEDYTVSTDDLLARTVMYKAGHHGSHNATLKEQGLEKMNSPELVTLIPVDEKFARDKKDWPIPFRELVERLEEKCHNRILRTDVKDPRKLKKPQSISEKNWANFLGRVKPQKMHIDYSVKWE